MGGSIVRRRVHVSGDSVISLHHGHLLLPPFCCRMAALEQSLGQDRAGAAARGAVGVLITLLLIEDHLHLVI